MPFKRQSQIRLMSDFVNDSINDSIHALGARINGIRAGAMFDRRFLDLMPPFRVRDSNWMQHDCTVVETAIPLAPGVRA